MSTGYLPLGSTSTATTGQVPVNIYGTEVFELNAALRGAAVQFARNATLADSRAAREYRGLYAGAPGGLYDNATGSPRVIECDASTSDVYFSGRMLGEAFANTTRAWTGGKGIYCTSQQEDNASLEVLLRGAVAGLVDFSRIIVMRTGSDFERPHLGETAQENLFEAEEQGAFEPAVENLYRAGIKVVEGILGDWERRFERGVRAGNYIGDVLGTLGGQPDFGPQAGSVAKRGMKVRRSR